MVGAASADAVTRAHDEHLVPHLTRAIDAGVRMIFDEHGRPLRLSLSGQAHRLGVHQLDLATYLWLVHGRIKAIRALATSDDPPPRRHVLFRCPNRLVEIAADEYGPYRARFNPRRAPKATPAELMNSVNDGLRQLADATRRTRGGHRHGA